MTVLGMGAPVVSSAKQESFMAFACRALSNMKRHAATNAVSAARNVTRVGVVEILATFRRCITDHTL